MISPQLNAGDPIIDDEGKMVQAFRNYLIKLGVGGIVLTGLGTPEAFIEAPQYTLYLDVTTPTVPVQYRKMLSNIAGDEKKGWIVV
jgi:hypothetical protein